MKMDPVIFREYDIRGIYNEQFDLEFAELLGKAFATYLHKNAHSNDKTITIGHDARHSSPDIVKALAKGATSLGVNVKTLGLVTTPMSYFSTFNMPEVVGAIMVTGSHNPPNYNGFKISVNKTTIHGEEIQKLKQIMQSAEFAPEKPAKVSAHDITDAYITRYKEEFGQLKDIPFVVDCGNGAAGAIVRKLYNAVGLNPTILFEEPDGDFPNHHPDPTVEKNLKALKEKVKETNSIVGIGFDGDADRIGLVDDTGRMIYGDELLAFYATDVLASQKGGKVIGDVKCSDKIFDYIEEIGGQPIMWKSGHSLVKNKIYEEKAPFGGEMSGHIFFNDRNYGFDDGPYAGLRVIEILAKTGKRFSELLRLPKTYSTPEIRVDTTEENKIKIVDKMRSEFSKESDEYSINTIDGIRIRFKDGWALVRASNTQPVVTMRFEANSEQSMNAIKDRVEAIVNPLL